jgi:hypothetical protein
MGGQACVFYGAAEFSRDVDIAVLAEPENLQKLQNALDALKAEVIAVPPFDEAFLQIGLAVHFRCHAAGAEGMRVDVMTKMRGVDPFPALWERRTTLAIDEFEVDLMSLPDLVQAKKTQRQKDWPMIQRLIEAHWFQYRHEPTPERIDFWLRECRTPEILRELTHLFPTEAAALQSSRAVIPTAFLKNIESIEKALDEERLLEVAADKAYWAPLRLELERLRHASRK